MNKKIFNEVIKFKITLHFEIYSSIEDKVL